MQGKQNPSIFAAVLVVLAVASPAARAQIANGDFGTGDLTGYTFTATGTVPGSTPDAGALKSLGNPALTPPAGRPYFGYFSDDNGLTASLTQSVFLPNVTQTLSFQLDFLTDEFNPADPALSTPASIDGTSNDYATVTLGGQTLLTISRDDLINLDAHGKLLSLKPGTWTDADQAGYYLSSGFRPYTFNVSSFAGQSVPLVFSVYDASPGDLPGQYHTGYDTGLALANIHLSPAAAAVPEPSPAATVCLGLMLLGPLCRRAWRRA